jgi:hypothetical protein
MFCAVFVIVIIFIFVIVDSAGVGARRALLFRALVMLVLLTKLSISLLLLLLLVQTATPTVMTKKKDVRGSKEIVLLVFCNATVLAATSYAGAIVLAMAMAMAMAMAITSVCVCVCFCVCLGVRVVGIVSRTISFSSKESVLPPRVIGDIHGTAGMVIRVIDIDIDIDIDAFFECAGAVVVPRCCADNGSFGRSSNNSCVGRDCDCRCRHYYV